MGVSRRGRLAGGRSWGVAAVVAAALVSAPLMVLPLAFLRRTRTWSIVADLLPGAIGRSLALAVGVAIGTLLLGTAFAVLVSFYEFPGRWFVEWAVVLPLGMPAYILTFVILGQYDGSTALTRVASAFGFERLPEVRTPTGAIVMLTLVLYPYVYLLARTAFLNQATALMEAARTLGLSHGAAIRRVALPLARPALAAGASLAVMEALADFGTVNLLGFRTLPDAIYRLWYGAFDRRAALQVGAVLLGLVALLLLLERATRRRSVEQTGASGGIAMRRRLHSWRAAVALGLPMLFLTVLIIGPVTQLVWWAIDSVRDSTYDPALWRNTRNSVLLASLTAVVTAFIAVSVVFAVRIAPTRTRRSSLRAATLGYAVPGSVAAAAVFLVADSVGNTFNLALTGTLGVLVAAYCLRFSTLAVQSAESRMAALPPSLDVAARSLGARPGRLLGEVHLPLLLPAVATGALMVFVEVLKELPATALLRPFGLDTLPISVFEATKESLYEAAALPALVLLLVSLVPVALLVRTVRPPGRRATRPRP